MLWVIGCKGMLGSQLCELLDLYGIEYTGTGSEVDVTAFEVLDAFAEKSFAGKKVDFIINCSAYTAVDKAEDESETAEKINSTGALNIAKVAGKLDCPLIHISTDYVFDGCAAEPVDENAEKNPQSVYGRTKAMGEDNIIRTISKYYILRTAWLYGFNGKNFVYTMTRAMQNRESVKVVCDQRGTPTNCSTLCRVILALIQKKNAAYGVYHVTDSGETTWFDFCREIYRLGTKYSRITNSCTINSCTTGEYPVKANRPAYSVLDTAKIQNELKIKLPDWKDSLEDFIKVSRFETIQEIYKNA